MNQDTVVHLAIQALTLTLEVSAPVLVVSLVVGLLVSIFQAATSIQEVTLTFIPKIIAAGVVIMIAGPWMLNRLIAYTQELFLRIPSLVGS
jgi:flagellar biosynthesis protein FliQ